MSLTEVMSTEPGKEVKQLFRAMENSIEPGTDDTTDPEFFVSNKLSFVERLTLKALLPSKSDAISYISKWANAAEYPQLTSMRGKQWLNKALTKLYS